MTTVPNPRIDTRLALWRKILQKYQNQPGADSRNNLNYNQGLRRVHAKLLKAMRGSQANPFNVQTVHRLEGLMLRTVKPLAVPIVPASAPTPPPPLPQPVLPVDGWWKADTIGLADGASVASWSDSSGNGFTMAQPNGALQPVYKLNIRNSLPVVRFANVANTGLFTTGMNINAVNWTVFIVYADNCPGCGGRTALQSTVDNNWLLGAYADDYKIYNNGFSSGSCACYAGGLLLYQTAWADNANAHSRVFGSEIGTTGTAGEILTDLAMNAAGIRNTNSSAQDIGEVLFYKRTLNASDITTTETYLKSRWGF